MKQSTPGAFRAKNSQTKPGVSMLKKVFATLASASLLTGLGAVPAAQAATADGSRDLVMNGSFDSGTSGWKTNDAKTQVLKVKQEAQGAVAELRTTSSGSVVLNDSTNTIGETEAGTCYSVSARVRTDNPGVWGQVRTRIVGNGENKVVSESFGLKNTSWTTVSYDLAVQKAGATVDLNVLAWSMDPSKNLIIDDVKMVKKSAASNNGCNPTPPPVKPEEPVAPELPGQTGRTQFGASLGGSTTGAKETFAQSMARQDKNYDDLEVVRLFEPNMPVSWSKRAPYIEGKTISISFRPDPAEVLSGQHDAALLNWFKTAPSDQPIYWTYFHEPEPKIASGQFTAAQYRAAWKHIANLADKANKPNMHATLVLTGWTANPRSKRDWRDYYAGDSVIDVLGWDPYNDASSVAGPTSYASPESVFGNVVAISKNAGKPFAVAETGTRLIPTDPNGTQRAAWLKDVARYLDGEGALFVAYWDSQTFADFRLSDSASRNSWAGIIDGKF
ncbi:carbohydrate binding domain-containing protein [Glutamicibacter protophormiae]|uniref:carbohydrate binding domain-containing protein n=1 Tax=Glutamicibacter protophormiae TaxID=37930 RepID=UPI00331D76E4